MTMKAAPVLDRAVCTFEGSSISEGALLPGEGKNRTRQFEMSQPKSSQRNPSVLFVLGVDFMLVRSDGYTFLHVTLVLQRDVRVTPPCKSRPEHEQRCVGLTNA